MRKEILAARALVLPSFAEGLPVVIMEAMALRRPVIASCVGGIPELVSPGEHGWLVPPGDAGALVEAIKACLELPLEVLRRRSDAAFQQVVKFHDLKLESARLAELIKETPKRG